MPSASQRPGFRVTALGVVFIGLFTLLPNASSIDLAASTPLTCVVCGQVGGVDFFLNILLFIPLGFGLGLAGVSWRRALMVSGMLSLGIEFLQLTVIIGRDASLGDVLTNTAGGGLGALIATRRRWIMSPTSRRAGQFALGWAGLLLLIWGGTAWALGLSLPSGTRWYGQWAPDLGYLAPFLGQPLSVIAGGDVLPIGPSDNQRELEARVAGRPEMLVTAVLGKPARRFAPIGGIMDANRREVMMLGQERQDLAFRLRLRAASIKLRVPTVNLKNGLAGQPGDTVEAEGALRDGAFELSSRIGGVVRTRTLPLSASWGWSLVTPWESILGEEVHGPSALWIAGLLVVLAYWGTLSGGAALGIAPLTAVLMIGAVPYAAGFPPAHWSEWAAAAAGIALGSILALNKKRNPL